MIPRSGPRLRPYGPLSGGLASAPPAPVPAWLRKAVAEAQTPAAQGFSTQGAEEAALAAGAAMAALDAVVRRRERWAGAWRQRLALAAGAATARQAGRAEDEAALRDAVLLTRRGDDAGPAGRMLAAWRRLASRPCGELSTAAAIAGVLEELGHGRTDDIAVDMADGLRELGVGEGLVGVLTGAAAIAERHGPARDAAAWIADALVAQRLGWTHAVPLLGGEAVLRARGGRSSARDLLAAQARAALRAVDLSAELGRRAERLLAVAPKLRAKAAGAVVERLLSDDAVVASERIVGISDRGLRRLFERLVELGAVRELSGRPAFRIYGL